MSSRFKQVTPAIVESVATELELEIQPFMLSPAALGNGGPPPPRTTREDDFMAVFDKRESGKARSMSRIYEALQKAESERKSERREPEPRNQNSRSAWNIFRGGGCRADRVILDLPPPTRSRTTLSRDIRPAQSRRCSMLGQIVRRRPWSLSWRNPRPRLERGTRRGAVPKPCAREYLNCAISVR